MTYVYLYFCHKRLTNTWNCWTLRRRICTREPQENHRTSKYAARHLSIIFIVLTFRLLPKEFNYHQSSNYKHPDPHNTKNANMHTQIRATTSKGNIKKPTRLIESISRSCTRYNSYPLSLQRGCSGQNPYQRGDSRPNPSFVSHPFHMFILIK